MEGWAIAALLLGLIIGVLWAAGMEGSAERRMVQEGRASIGGHTFVMQAD